MSASRGTGRAQLGPTNLPSAATPIFAWLIVASATLGGEATAQSAPPPPQAEAQHQHGVEASGPESDNAPVAGAHQHAGAQADGDPGMQAALGSYPATREVSGTAWQPDSIPMDGVHFEAGPWQLMAHGAATLTYTDQGGPRGDDMLFVPSWAMLMGSRPIGERGRLRLQAMVSLDPLMGRRGYPLLFAAGETADGVTTLVDRQHPHDFAMELSASFSRDLGDGNSVFLYAGLPGEPALGPPAFMHRASARMNPEAPIGHHWADSTHITFGVLTAGFATQLWKIEGSVFRGREPDQRRWDLETPRFDSWSVRASLNPTANLSFQASHGFLRSPEQLHPDEDERRTTVSLTYNRPFGRGGRWTTTLAYLWKDIEPGPILEGWLLETNVSWGPRHTVFARHEGIEAGELFAHPDPLHHEVFTIGKTSLGYAYSVPVGLALKVDLGAMVSRYVYSSRLEPVYGPAGLRSFMLFMRIRLGR